MEYHAQPRSHELPTVSEISPQQFYARFKVTGDATFAHLLHPKFRFVVDGFAAAVVLAENSVLDRADADDDKEVRKLLLGRQVLPDDLVSFPFPRDTAPATHAVFEDRSSRASSFLPIRSTLQSRGDIRPRWKALAKLIGTRPVRSS